MLVVRAEIYQWGRWGLGLFVLPRLLLFCAFLFFVAAAARRRWPGLEVLSAYVVAGCVCVEDAPEISIGDCEGMKRTSSVCSANVTAVDGAGSLCSWGSTRGSAALGGVILGASPDGVGTTDNLLMGGVSTR